MKSLIFILIAIVTLNAKALEKCELPLFYFDEATFALINDNDVTAKRNFIIGFNLHDLLESECTSEAYDASVHHYLSKYAEIENDNA